MMKLKDSRKKKLDNWKHYPRSENILEHEGNISDHNLLSTGNSFKDRKKSRPEELRQYRH